MNLQLQRGDTAHYCFVTDAPIRAKSNRARGKIIFTLEFVHAVRLVPDDEESDVENVPEGELRLTLPEFAAWWAKETDWRVVDV